MKKHHIRQAALLVAIVATSTIGLAQETPTPPPPPPTGVEHQGPDNIVIRKKGNKDEKMVIIVDGDKITVNGKPIGEYKGEDVIINDKRLHELVDKELHMAEMNKHLAEMDNQLANLDRQIEVEVAPHVRNNIRYHYRTPHVFSDDQAPMVFSFDGDDESGGDPKAFLGVSTEKTDKGVKVTSVTDESAAGKAGLAKGDIITALDGKKVEDHEQLTKLVREHKPGDEVSVSYIRDGKSKKTKVKLGETRGMVRSFNLNAPSPDIQDFKFEAPEMPEMPDMEGLTAPDFGGRFPDRGPRLGVRVEDIADAKGVKVTDVRPGSPAEKAGIQNEDIITHVDNKDINDASDVMDALKDAKGKPSFWISVQRKGSPVNVEVKIPKPIRKADL